MKTDRTYSFTLFLVGLSILIHFRNLFAPIFTQDSALYADVALQIFRTKDFLHLIHQGKPFLDKPYMFFWLSAVSYAIFGINSFAFKFPSFLALLITLSSIYKLANQYYNKTVAIYATLITASSLGVVFMTNDVRMEMLLTCFIVTGVWQFSSYLLSAKIQYLLSATLCFAVAYYTKGAEGFIIPLVAIAPQMIIKPFSLAFKIRTLLLLSLFLLFFLTPLLFISYGQFGWDGVRYFVWGHIADRVSGKLESNNPDTFFVWHTTLWVVAPWTLFLLAGVLNVVRGLFKRGENKNNVPEVFCISGLLFGLLALSFSSYQLSYYVYPLIPFAAIVAASNSASYWSNQKFVWIQRVVNSAAIFVATVIIWYVTTANVFYVACFLTLILVSLYANKKGGILIVTAAAAVTLNFILSFVFFPAILKYQPYEGMAEFANTHKLTDQNLVFVNMGIPYQYEFFSTIAPRQFENFNAVLAANKKTPYYAITNQQGYDSVLKSGAKVTVEKRLLSFWLTRLSWEFLNPKTREAACDKFYILKMNAP